MLAAAFTAYGSPGTKNLLLSAGFKAKIATTAKQRQDLTTLREGEVSPVTQQGRTFYIYPDAPRNQIYIGNEAQYRAYRNLIAQKRGSEDAIVRTDYVRGTAVKVREFYEWGPLGE